MKRTLANAWLSTTKMLMMPMYQREAAREIYARNSLCTGSRFLGRSLCARLLPWL